jgi:molecular chaperone DnaK (HSP70)
MNKQSGVSLDCLCEDEDLEDHITREEFDQLNKDVLVKIMKVSSDMKDYLTKNNQTIHSVELLGGGTRIPSIKEIFKSIFNMETSTTLNQDESCSEGASVACAIESPT